MNRQEQTSSVVWKHVVGPIAGLMLGASSAWAGQTASAPAPRPDQTAAVQAPAAEPSGPTLALSTDEAVAMALETSLGLQSQRLNLNIAAQSIASARSAFLPEVSSSLSRTNRQSPSFVREDGTIAVSSSAGLSGSTTVQQTLPWLGSGVTSTWSANRNTSAGSSATFNPQLGSTFSFDFTQPLWRNLRIDAARHGLQSAQRQNVITDLQLQQQIIQTEISVRMAYSSLVAAIASRNVAQQNLELAEQSLRNARARVAVGQSPEIDIITSEVQVESSRESLITATARIESAEDALREQILDANRPDYWTVRLEPTEPIQLTPREIDVDAAIKNALASRLDYQTVQRQMELTDLDLALSRNATKPSVNFRLGYSASGTGGTEFLREGGTRVVGFGSVLGDAFGGTFPAWTTGISVSYPIGHTSARAGLARAEIQKQQDVLALRQLELRIVGAVRQAARSVRSSFQRVQVTQAARQASERQLEAEERKFAVGLSDTFQLQQRQRDLASARTSELNAIIDYNNALIQFDRVQKIP
jgi:outer membrane protein